MSGEIIVPSDRIETQAAQGYCRNPACLESSDQKQFIFEVTESPVRCPKCHANAPPMVGLKALIHALIPDEKGPISGHGGLRYRIGCDSKRAYLATATNQEAVTSDINSVNCPGCLAEMNRLGLKKSGWKLKPQG